MWTYDTAAIARGIGKGLLGSAGDTWFLIGVDYAFSTAMEKELREVIEQSGGKVVGSVKHPLGTADFGSFLLQAQALALRSSAC
jgi:branched-chain amino acid transport system substrate-binding protein